MVTQNRTRNLRNFGQRSDFTATETALFRIANAILKEYEVDVNVFAGKLDIVNEAVGDYLTDTGTRKKVSMNLDNPPTLNFADQVEWYCGEVNGEKHLVGLGYLMVSRHGRRSRREADGSTPYTIPVVLQTPISMGDASANARAKVEFIRSSALESYESGNISQATSVVPFRGNWQPRDKDGVKGMMAHIVFESLYPILDGGDIPMVSVPASTDDQMEPDAS